MLEPAISIQQHKKTTHLRRIPRAPNHLLYEHRPHLLLGLAHPDGHVAQDRRVSDVRGVAVADDVGGPLVLGRVGVARADVAGLQGLEVLEGAELVSHFGWLCVMGVWNA